jgi:tetratricopeptide (TPR) repeat protein
MSNLTRKDFIRLSSWAFVATLLPTGEINAMTSVFSPDYIPSTGDFKKAQELAKEAKVFFYKKNFAKAEELYLQCIKLAPSSIRFYDNLDNVYGVKNNHLASVELFKNGLLKNPKIIAFYDRAAHSLMRLELGNKKSASKFKGKMNSQSLLKDAELLYHKAIAIDGTKKYLTVGLEKVKSKMNPTLSINSKTVKTKKVEARKQLKKEIGLKSDIEIEALINKVDTKKRTQLFAKEEIVQQQLNLTKQKKEYIKVLLSKNKGDAQKSIGLSEKLFELDYLDPISIKQLKSVYYANNKYFDFISKKQKFAEKKQTIYSYLGVIDAIEMACEKKQAVPDSLSNAIAVGNMVLGNFNLLETTEVDVVDKIAKLHTLQFNFSEAKKITEYTIGNLTTSSPAVINKIVYRYAHIYYAEDRLEEAKNILRIALGQSENENNAFSKIKEIALNKTKETFKHKLILYYLLFEVYHKLNDNDNAVIVLNKITEINPKDQFLIKRI